MNSRWLRAILLAALGVFFAASWLTYRPAQWPAPFSVGALFAAPHPCGPLGLLATHASIGALGRAASGALAVLLGLGAVAAILAWDRRRALRSAAHVVGAMLLVAALTGLVDRGDRRAR